MTEQIQNNDTLKDVQNHLNRAVHLDEESALLYADSMRQMLRGLIPSYVSRQSKADFVKDFLLSDFREDGVVTLEGATYEVLVGKGDYGGHARGYFKLKLVESKVAEKIRTNNILANVGLREQAHWPSLMGPTIVEDNSRGDWLNSDLAQSVIGGQLIELVERDMRSDVLSADIPMRLPFKRGKSVFGRNSTLGLNQLLFLAPIIDIGYLERSLKKIPKDIEVPLPALGMLSWAQGYILTRLRHLLDKSNTPFADLDRAHEALAEIFFPEEDEVSGPIGDQEKRFRQLLETIPWSGLSPSTSWAYGFPKDFSGPGSEVIQVTLSPQAKRNAFLDLGQRYTQALANAVGT